MGWFTDDERVHSSYQSQYVSRDLRLVKDSRELSESNDSLPKMRLNTQRISVHRKPVPRSAHGAAVYDKKMWIFAGYDGNVRLNDMWCTALMSSTQGPTAGPLEKRTWEEVGSTFCFTFSSADSKETTVTKTSKFAGRSTRRKTANLLQFPSLCSSRLDVCV